MRVCELLCIDSVNKTYTLKFVVMGNPEVLVESGHCPACTLMAEIKEEDGRKTDITLGPWWSW